MPPHPINLPSLLTTALFLLLLLIGDHRRPTLAAVHSLIYAACSPDKYPPNTPYETSLNSLLSSIAASSSNVLYNHFSTAAEPPPPGGESAPTTAYGLYQCRGDLTHRDCSLCVADLLGQMSRLCPSAYGSSVQLDGCFVRYEDTDFVSVPDDGLRYRRCRGGGGGRDFVRRRDGLLEELEGRAREEATGGWFGAVAEGGVEELCLPNYPRFYTLPTQLFSVTLYPLNFKYSCT
ncbi:cysteine-rich repeat secretory protein 15 [Striga asiatica]|uniref:Cysteine-rich repeat secretory protein 15 n=1 Tax=Striga asiatica TaxID=4170 RepID=A0A5A7P2I4_STRAF|nr:cysteine-rich repeat secretory protein 15 [Striga asiatica]